MRATTRPRVKICCISNNEEARLAIEHGASALGLVSRMPSGPSDAQLSAQTRTLRIRQRRSFDFSIEFSTSPLRAAAILAQSDFHEVSRAGRPYRTASKKQGEHAATSGFPSARNASRIAKEAPGISLVQVMHAGSTGRRNTCAKFTRRSLKAQSFSRTLI